jgi:pimeloyl-ACP methyl ester carboxylesterase
MGDVGRSVQRVAFDGTEDVARWLGETLDALPIGGPAHLVGNSNGAWLALNLVRHDPAAAAGRVRTLSLLDPAGMAKLSYRFFAWGAKVFAAAFMPARLRLRAARRLGMPMLEDTRVMRMAFGGQLNHRFRQPVDVIPDDDLRAVTVPTLLLIGGKSEIYRPEDVLARARATMPNLEAEIVPDVGHALPVDPRADAPRRVREFLARVEQGRSAAGST